ncbi:MAG: hypothetical protein J6L83_01675 [Clostridia bacterium]|nr:hypothetical protein [Clostridia bacterium]
MKKNAQNEKKNIKTVIENNKKPIIIGAICTGAVAVAVGLGKAFSNMKKNAKAQHEVDKAEFAAVKAEAKANFEENRGRNTFRRAKANAKKSWDDAHMSISEREEKAQAERNERIANAEARINAANERIESAQG